MARLVDITRPDLVAMTSPQPATAVSASRCVIINAGRASGALVSCASVRHRSAMRGVRRLARVDTSAGFPAGRPQSCVPSAQGLNIDRRDSFPRSILAAGQDHRCQGRSFPWHREGAASGLFGDQHGDQLAQVGQQGRLAQVSQTVGDFGDDFADVLPLPVGFQMPSMAQAWPRIASCWASVINLGDAGEQQLVDVVHLELGTAASGRTSDISSAAGAWSGLKSGTARRKRPLSLRPALPAGMKRPVPGIRGASPMVPSLNRVATMSAEALTVKEARRAGEPPA